MPLYDFQCAVCAKVAEYSASMSETELQCALCGHVMKRLITTHFTVIPDMAPYYDRIIGHRWVKGRKDRKELLRSKEMTLD